jgi:hypothetical protein
MTSDHLQNIFRCVRGRFSDCLLYFFPLCLCGTNNVKTTYKNLRMYSNQKHSVLESPRVPSIPVPLKSEPSLAFSRRRARLLSTLDFSLAN